jgi:predicted protein tyrosine phosphatase
MSDMTMSQPLRVLFVCGRNRWRSPTAERIYRDDARLAVRSAGVSGSATHVLNEADLDWADLVLVMERRYATRIRSDFGSRKDIPRMESLDIPDEYGYMDPELIALIRSGVEPHISNPKPIESSNPALSSSTPPAGQGPGHP